MKPLDRPRSFSRRSIFKGAAAATLAVGAGTSVVSDSASANDQDPALTKVTEAVQPFRIAVPASALADLNRRLEQTRWPEQETAPDWSQGSRLSKMRELVNYWRTRYDWRRAEQELNQWPQFRTRLDGLGIHFIHVKSKHSGAMPLLLTHGWPGSVIEFLKTVGPLTDPTRFGGKASDAFDVVIPSLPGFGFSDRPTEPGWDLTHTAKAWGELMNRLGYTRWVAQGGDWGGGVTIELGQQQPKGLAGVHLNFALVFPETIPASGMSPEESAAAKAFMSWVNDGSGYARIMATRPQTIGYGLADSPVAQASWIYEKFQAWSDNSGSPETALTFDEMLDNISLYWFTNTGASSGRYYRENITRTFSAGPIDIPVGVSVFPREIFRAPKSWVQQNYKNLIYWNELEKGGHFAAFEEPELFVGEMRACFAKLR